MVSLRTRVTGSADVAAGMVYVRCGEVDEVEVEVRDRETRSDRLWRDGRQADRATRASSPSEDPLATLEV